VAGFVYSAWHFYVTAVIPAGEGLDGTLTTDCKFYALVRFGSIDISRRWLPDLRALRFLNGIEANDSARR
jgi:hypothetical protein